MCRIARQEVCTQCELSIVRAESSLEDDSDMKLVQKVKEHADEAHPDRYEEAELRLLVSTTAYDAAA